MGNYVCQKLIKQQ